jgi:hypothetical protein
MAPVQIGNTMIAGKSIAHLTKYSAVMNYPPR